MNKLAVAAVAAVALSLAACGVPTSSAPDALDNGQIPNGLLSYRPETGTTQDGPNESLFQVYFFSSGSLIAATRATKKAISPALVLGVLEDGPTSADRPGESTLLPATNPPRYVSLVDQIVTVALPPGQEYEVYNIGALAQIVWTLTALRGVKAVQFEADSKPVRVANGSGYLVQGPVTQADYENFAPPLVSVALTHGYPQASSRAPAPSSSHSTSGASDHSRSNA